MSKRKKEIPFPIMAISFIFCETLIFVFSEILSTDISVSAAFIRLSISILTTFLLTFFYKTTLLNRVFFTLSFQAIFALSEFLSQFVVQNIIFNSSDESIEIIDNIALLTPPISFFLIIFISIILKKKKMYLFKQYSVLLLITPIITIFTAYNRNVLESALRDPLSYSFLVFGFLIINYSNYVLLVLSAKSYEEKEKNNYIIQQNEYQKKKYNQLSSAYKKIRKYQHDTKKRFLYITDCIQAQKYDEISSYLEESLNELNSSYSRINTGNLVIDSFVSNYISVAEDNGIRFYSDLQINPTIIPIKDYDLSIILGNLLDNAINACNDISSSDNKYIKLFINTNIESGQFIIHILNSCQKKLLNGKTDELLHGYGIENIKNHIENFYGILNTKENEHEFESSVIIPLAPPPIEIINS